MPVRSGMASTPASAGRAVKGSRTTLRYSSLAVITMVAVLLAALLYRPDQAKADNPPGNTYVALGDSYSSGEGAPPYLTSSCDRSTSSWVTGFAADLGAGVGYTNNACAGATAADVINQGQLGSLGPNTQLVTITIGGNDLGFGPALTSCTTGVSCDGLQVPLSQFDALQASLHSLYQYIVSLAPNATLLVVSYPDIWSPSNSVCAPQTGLMGTGQIQLLNSDVSLMNRTIQLASYGVDRTQFVDSNTDPATSTPAWTGHDVCASDGMREFNGISDGVSQNHTAAAFHPNWGGHAIWSIIMYRYINAHGISITAGGGSGGGGGGGGGGGSPSPAPNPPPWPNPAPAPEPTGTASSTISYGPPGGGNCSYSSDPSGAPCN